jgi:enoyl-CoA hydratase
MSAYDYRYLTVAKSEGIGVVTLNRPDSMNAFSHAMHREFEDVMIEIAEDTEIRAVVLTGAGRAFCAGGDLEDMKNPATRKGPRVMSGSRRLPYAMLEVKQPIICAVNGHAVGIGATIALFCDIVIMAESAKIGDPHVKVGLVAGDGGAVIWPLLIGLNRAKELLLTGDLVTAPEAHRMGLVNRVVPDGKALEAAMGLAGRLAGGAALAIQWTKLSINRMLRQATEQVLDASLALEGMTITSQDHLEGIAAFLEKRPPRFKGQ